MEQLKIKIGIFTICFLLDLLSFFCSRELLKDFLRGTLGKTKAEKAWRSVSVIDSLNISFLKQYIGKNSKLFYKFYIFYLTFLFSLLPKYILMLVLNIFIGGAFQLIVNILNIVFSFCVFFIFRLPQLPHGRTKYIHYSRKNHQ